MKCFKCGKIIESIDSLTVFHKDFHEGYRNMCTDCYNQFRKDFGVEK